MHKNLGSVSNFQTKRENKNINIFLDHLLQKALRLKIIKDSWEMTQWIQALADKPEDLSSITDLRST